MSKRFLLFVLYVLLVLSTINYSLAEKSIDQFNLLEIEEELRKSREALDMSIAATKPLEVTLTDLENRINNLQAQINAAQAKMEAIEKDIFQREVDLGVQKELLHRRIRSLYKRQHHYSPFLVLLSSQNAAQLTRELFFKETVTNEDRKIINQVSSVVKNLKNDQDQLAKDKISLAALQKEIDSQADFFRKEIKGAKEYQASLSQKIAQLTARQQAILTARTGTFTSSVGEVPISNIPCSGPPGSPTYCDPGGGTWLAAFSFGAWTHRKGMSQYGAKGRVEAGQNFEQVLEHYYDRKPVSKDTSGTISVQGFGNLDFENYYLLGIAEMPSDWPKEALKAQAIAARTFAYRYKIEGLSICTTQACQVFSQSKANNPPGPWREAVQETQGQVIDGVTGFYSSTAGGYLTTSGWDTTDGQGGEGFATRAWESKAQSPWFYSSWFTQSYYPNSSKCNRSHPWLTEEEMTDILNAWQVLQVSGSDERILPVTINQCPIGGSTGNPYSISELREKANQTGGVFTNVNGVSVVYANDGVTNSVNFTTNKGSVTISGSEFKQAFNLRAPGYIAIRSPLFNLEKK